MGLPTFFSNLVEIDQRVKIVYVGANGMIRWNELAMAEIWIASLAFLQNHTGNRLLHFDANVLLFIYSFLILAFSWFQLKF